MSRASKLVLGSNKHKVQIGMTHGRDIADLMGSFDTVMTFTDEEIRRGEALLRNFGVTSGDEVVCLLVRDPAYIAAIFGAESPHNDYRDSEIRTYRLMAEELADRGCFVFRMGQVVAEPLVSANSRVVDYANDDRRSAFLDIYLARRCSFAISTTSGWDVLPVMFHRPVVYVNHVAVGYAMTMTRNSLHLFKGHKSVNDGRLMSLKEIFESDVAYALATQAFVAANVELIPNSAEEIRDVAMEMWDRVHGSWIEHPDDHDLQERFWRAYRTDGVQADGVPLHGELNMRYGAQFLRDNPWWVA